MPPFELKPTKKMASSRTTKRDSIRTSSSNNRGRKEMKIACISGDRSVSLRLAERGADLQRRLAEAKLEKYNPDTGIKVQRIDRDGLLRLAKHMGHAPEFRAKVDDISATLKLDQYDLLNYGLILLKVRDQQILMRGIADGNEPRNGNHLDWDKIKEYTASGCYDKCLGTTACMTGASSSSSQSKMHYRELSTTKASSSTSQSMTLPESVAGASYYRAYTTRDLILNRAYSQQRSFSGNSQSMTLRESVAGASHYRAYTTRDLILNRAYSQQSSFSGNSQSMTLPESEFCDNSQSMTLPESVAGASHYRAYTTTDLILNRAYSQQRSFSGSSQSMTLTESIAGASSNYKKKSFNGNSQSATLPQSVTGASSYYRKK